MKEGDFVKIDYVGRVSESGEIFDLTKEDVAKKEGIFKPNFQYGPIPIIVGANFTIVGLEKVLKEMNVGDKKKVKIDPKEAFGERKAELIKLIPLSQFKKQNMDPYPGMPVNVNNLTGRVLSVSGGRVRVDFNHVLAGKTLEYEIEVKEKITKKSDKIKGIVEFLTKIKDKEIEVSIDKEVVEIKIKRDISRKIKKNISDMIMKWIKNIKVTRFIDEFTQ
jgi:FKBP-type peptidyl-prolyl cis-trans isomerase 2